MPREELLSNNEAQFIVKVLSWGLMWNVTSTSTEGPDAQNLMCQQRLTCVPSLLRQALQEEQRIDGRRPFDYREVQYQVGGLPHCSARVPQRGACGSDPPAGCLSALPRAPAHACMFPMHTSPRSFQRTTAAPRCCWVALAC